MAVSKKSPMPFHWNTVSVTTAPPMIDAMSSAVTVVNGMSAVRSACLTITVRRERPFDRANRT
jgi:hypothetical protein